jgi:hypothetical protein
MSDKGRRAGLVILLLASSLGALLLLWRTAFCLWWKSLYTGEPRGQYWESQSRAPMAGMILCLVVAAVSFFLLRKRKPT